MPERTVPINSGNTTGIGVNFTEMRGRHTVNGSDVVGNGELSRQINRVSLCMPAAVSMHMNALPLKACEQRRRPGNDTAARTCC
eukprot:3323826-Rhodomonas_salina.1